MTHFSEPSSIVEWDMRVLLKVRYMFIDSTYTAVLPLMTSKNFKHTM